MKTLGAISCGIASAVFFAFEGNLARADDVNVAGRLVATRSGVSLGGRPVGLYGDAQHGQHLDADTTSPTALYSLATRGVSGNVISLYVLYDGSDSDARPVQIRPEPPQKGLRRAKADDLVLLDARTLLNGVSGTAEEQVVSRLAASFFSDLEVRMWAKPADSEIDGRIAGFIARVGGSARDPETQLRRIGMIWSDHSLSAITETFNELQIETKTTTALRALQRPGVAQLLRDHFLSEHPDDVWRSRFNVGEPLRPSVIEGWEGSLNRRSQR